MGPVRFPSAAFVLEGAPARVAALEGAAFDAPDPDTLGGLAVSACYAPEIGKTYSSRREAIEQVAERVCCRSRSDTRIFSDTLNCGQAEWGFAGLPG